MGRKPKKLTTWRIQVAAHLKQLRTNRFETQAEFATALAENGLEVHVVTISGWERGYRLPSIEELPAIGAALGCPISALLPVTPEETARLLKMIEEAKARAEEIQKALAEFTAVQAARPKTESPGELVESARRNLEIGQRILEIQKRKPGK
jgi:transcriptional regulator with XRE-family HTH domain